MYKQLTIFQCPFCEIPYDNKFSRFNSNLNLSSADDEPLTVSAIQGYDDLLPITLADIDTSGQVQESLFSKIQPRGNWINTASIPRIEEGRDGYCHHKSSLLLHAQGRINSMPEEEWAETTQNRQKNYLFAGFEVCRDFFFMCMVLTSKLLKTLQNMLKSVVCVWEFT